MAYSAERLHDVAEKEGSMKNNLNQVPNSGDIQNSAKEDISGEPHIIGRHKEVREHIKYRGRKQHGKTTCEIICPFCEWRVIAFVWSLSGSGKKCPRCGALHGSTGSSIKNSDLA